MYIYKRASSNSPINDIRVLTRLSGGGEVRSLCIESLCRKSSWECSQEACFVGDNGIGIECETFMLEK